MASPGRNGYGTVLVVGASGFLGLEIVRAFAQHGWEVRGLIRDPAKRGRVRSAGATPIVGDILEPSSLLAAASGADTIVHVAANPPADRGGTDRSREVRVDGVRHLVAAARSGAVRRLLVGSGYWVYADQPGLITEESQVDPRGESRVNYDTEREALAANRPGELDVLIVRPGMVYGDGAWFRPVVTAIERDAYHVIDEGKNLWSFVSLPDTGTGFFTVATAGRPGEVYNLVDGHPAAWGEFATFVAQRLGHRAPATITFGSAAREYGPEIAYHLAANRATSSAKLQALGWQPKFPEFRSGVSEVLGRRSRASPG